MTMVHKMAISNSMAAVTYLPRPGGPRVHGSKMQQCETCSMQMLGCTARLLLLLLFLLFLCTAIKRAGMLPSAWHAAYAPVLLPIQIPPIGLDGGGNYHAHADLEIVCCVVLCQMSAYYVGRCFFGRGQPVVVLRLRRLAKPRRERALCRQLSPQKKADMTILGVITTSPASPIVFADWWLLSGRPQVTFRNTHFQLCVMTCHRWCLRCREEASRGFKRPLHRNNPSSRLPLSAA